jgi:hypothetical protein
MLDIDAPGKWCLVLVAGAIFVMAALVAAIHAFP